jgi:two-component system NtrC family response regulator
MDKSAVLVIDDDKSLLRVVEHHLTQMAFNVTACSDAKKGLALLEKEAFAVVLTDLKMPGISGHEILDFSKQRRPETVVIMLTGFPTIDDAVKAMQAGAFNFIQKPVERDKLISVVQKAAEVYTLRNENRKLRTLVSDHLEFGRMIGSAPIMKQVYRMASQVAVSNAPVLIYGETGTGKELLAKAIHNNSQRKAGPFIAVNCAAIPRDLLESELFGHEKGAFTGAVQKKEGRFVQADKGTLFLDEIGDMSLDLQAKLLRVLQDFEIQPVGSNVAQKVDVRVISATHRDLKSLIKKNLFREDLYFRLKVVPIHLPPLRERRSDIPLLFSHFIKEQAMRDDKPLLKVDQKVIQVLEHLDWPGNVRELENLAYRLVALDSKGIIELDDLPEGVKEAPQGKKDPFSIPHSGLNLEEWIDRIYVMALEKNNWNQSKTARFLNVSRNQVLYRMDKRGLHKKD